MNPFQYTQVNVREQCSWTHTDDHEGATEKAVRLVRAGINRTRLTEPLEPIVVETTPQEPRRRRRHRRPARGPRSRRGRALRLPRGEGAEARRLGGRFRRSMYPHGRNGAELIAKLEEKVRSHPAITVFTQRRAGRQEREFRQLPGDDRGRQRRNVRCSSGARTLARLRWNLETIQVDVGSIVIATGFDTYQPAEGELGYGIDGVITIADFKKLLDESDGPLQYDGRPVEHSRLHLLRGQPPGRERRGRPHVLFALLLHRRRAHRDRGRGPAGARAPVPLLPRHADLREVRAALRRGAREGLGVRQVPRRRAAGGGEGRKRPAASR